MSNNMLLQEQDLENYPTPRIPICLCLDTSGSMGEGEGDCVKTGEKAFTDGAERNVVTGGTSRIDELKKGVELFCEAIRDSKVAMDYVEIGIVTFDSNATCVMDFANIE